MALKWGIIGAGGIANKFAADLLLNPNAKLHAVAARDLDRAKNFAKQHQGEAAFDNYERIVDSADIDVVYVSLTHNFHFEWAQRCIEAGKPILVEKPFTLNAYQAATLFELADKNNVFVMEAFWSKFQPAITQAVSAAKNGDIGEIKHLEANLCIDRPFKPDHRLYNIALGGGALMDVGVYPIAMALWLLSKPKAWQSLWEPAPTGVDSFNEVNASWESGQTATLRSGIDHDDNTSHVIVTGSKGSVKIPHMWLTAQSYELHQASDEKQVMDIPFEGNGLRFQTAEVERCLSLGLNQSDQHSWQDTLDILTWTDALRNEWQLSYPSDL